jgi:hypothetical protein
LVKIELPESATAAMNTGARIPPEIIDPAIPTP